MKPAVWISAALGIALACGTLADSPVPRQPRRLGPYQVLAADFHLHSGLFSGGVLTPWGLVLEAERQGLDAIAITGHNETWDAHVGRAFSRFSDGPIVLIGEEITSPTQDLVAIGIQTTISPRIPLAEQIADVHRQGGVAIAAHPGTEYQHAYLDTGAGSRIDGTEVCHPSIYSQAGRDAQYAAFIAATHATPIGSSDFHSSGRVGMCRTFVFVTEVSAEGVLDAIRAHRTVVYGAGGRAFGDPALVALANGARLGTVAEAYRTQRGTPLDWASRLAAGIGLFGIAFVAWRRRH